MEEDFIDLIDFIPEQILIGKNFNKSKVYFGVENNFIKLNYSTFHGLNSKRKHHLVIPRYVSKNLETFEVLGLLQAEMRKTQDGAVSFTNHEYNLVNKVMNWFEKEFDIPNHWWRWHLTVNINKPKDEVYKKEIESKVINYWLGKTNISENKLNPVSVVYIKDTKNKKLRYYDYGSLNIYYKLNLFSQIIKKYVREMSNFVPSLEKKYINGFMRGIIAGEGCVENEKKHRHFRVHLTAKDKLDRDLYQNCLEKLSIDIKQYNDYKEMIISKKINHIKLLKQKLLCLSPQKYNKFLT